MREQFWNWFCKNAIEYNLYFVCTDLWRFLVPDNIKDRVIDLATAEDLTWPVAAGVAREGARVFTYGVSFFNIGRLESLRSEIIHAGLDCYILNAGAYGYDQWGPSHSFYKEDDIKIMKALNIYVIDPDKNQVDLEQTWIDFARAEQKTIAPSEQNNTVVYLRLGRD